MFAGWRRIVAGMRQAIALAFLAMLSLPAAARDNSASRSENSVTGVLPNGLHYYIENLPSADRVRLTMLVDAGFYDGRPETDAAHVVEHLVAHDAMTLVSAWGGAAGRDVNATTGFTSTSYYLDLPADNAPALEAAFSIMLQWASPQRFSDDAIDREIKATIEESRGTSGTPGRLLELRRRAWFENDPILAYKQNADGTSNATPQAVRAFHASWYRPPHLAIVATGKLDPRAIERDIRIRFSQMSSGGPANKRTPIDFRLSGANHFARFAVPDGAGSSIALTYKRPLPRSYAARLEDVVVARFASALLDPVTARLREKYSPAVLGGGFLPSFDGFGRPAGITFMTGQFDLREQTALDGAAEIFALVEAVRRDGFPPARIEEVRAALLAEAPELDTPSRSAARWASVFLDGERPLADVDLHRALRTISAGRINRLLALWFAPRNRDIIFSAPARSLPAEGAIEDLLARATATPVMHLADAAVRPPVLPEVLPSWVAVGEPLVRDGYYVWTLPASRAVLIYRRVAGASDIRVEGVRAGGFRRLAAAERGLALAAATVVPNSGLGGADKFALAHYLDGEKMMVEPYAAPWRDGFRAEGPKEAMDRLFTLTRASLFAPDCRAEALEEYRANEIEQRRGTADAASVLTGLIAAKLDLTATLDDDALAGLDLKSVCAAWRSLFSDTRGFAIAVEGDLDPGDLAAAVGASLDVAAPDVSAGGLGERDVRESGTGRDTIVAGEGSMATVQLVVQRKSSGIDAVEGSARIANRLLKDRLTARLRGVEKGTYAVNVQTVASTRPDATYVAIQFDCDAANVERLLAAARTELTLFREYGATPEEIGAAEAMAAPSPNGTNLRDLAENWVARGTLVPARSSRTDVNSWFARYLDPAFIHIFVRLPVGAGHGR